MAAAALQKL